METRIVAAAAGRELGPGRVGHIEVRVPTPMAGYVGDVNGSRKALTLDGWLRTGDLGYTDREGSSRLPAG